jgi:hypothetical protein
MSDEKKPFTVTDRRHFTSEGTVRSESEKASSETKPAESQPEPPGNPQPAIPPATEPPPDLGGFLLSLGAQGGLLLEGGVGPDGEQVPPDLVGARQIIGILEMLRDKTEGRRTPEETRILEGLLYQLRMAYLARSGVVNA